MVCCCIYLGKSGFVGFLVYSQYPLIPPGIQPQSVAIALIVTVYVRQLYRQVLLRARISYGNSVCPSVCPCAMTRYRIKPGSDRDTGFSPYDSLEFLLSSEII